VNPDDSRFASQEFAVRTRQGHGFVGERCAPSQAGPNLDGAKREVRLSDGTEGVGSVHPPRRSLPTVETGHGTGETTVRMPAKRSEAERCRLSERFLGDRGDRLRVGEREP
jgi:hypothetical protein